MCFLLSPVCFCRCAGRCGVWPADASAAGAAEDAPGRHTGDPALALQGERCAAAAGWSPRGCCGWQHVSCIWQHLGAQAIYLYPATLCLSCAASLKASSITCLQLYPTAALTAHAWLAVTWWCAGASCASGSGRSAAQVGRPHASTGSNQGRGSRQGSSSRWRRQQQKGSKG